MNVRSVIKSYGKKDILDNKVLTFDDLVNDYVNSNINNVHAYKYINLKV